MLIWFRKAYFKNPTYGVLTRRFRIILYNTHYFLYTDCPKMYRKSVLHLVQYIANLYLSRCSADLQGKSLCIRLKMPIHAIGLPPPTY